MLFTPLQFCTPLHSTKAKASSKNQHRFYCPSGVYSRLSMQKPRGTVLYISFDIKPPLEQLTHHILLS
jgi:hypothetical protein